MDQHSFLFQAIIYLTSAVVFVPIAKRLGLGSVLGYLLAGIIIGPYFLKFIGTEGEDIMHFAEFGVVMMLFVIGLELEPELLWKLRKSIVGMGGLQVAGCTLVILFICYLLGFSWQESLVLGMILSLSSTAIVLQTLAEKDLMKTAAGQSAFAVLLFQDIAVIPMLAVLPLLSENSSKLSTTTADQNWVSGQPAWIHALIVFGCITAVIIAGRLFVKPLLRLVAKTGIREVFTACALLIVVAMAVLMTQIGLSPALGAFLAGVVLANSEYKHELESDIEPFKGLLLGLFFIAVGASINFHLILARPLEVLLWVVSLIVLKCLVMLLIGKAFKMSSEQNFIASFALSQVGEFAFVLLSFSLQQGLLQTSTSSLMTAVVAISMAFTPLVFLINEKLILPRIGTEEENEREADHINERNPVIIAGFGHFGSTVGRFLRANKIGATYLDINSDRVDVLRKMGFKVFYGDASRHDLLHAAGAMEARIFIIAIDSQEKRMEMIETIKKHFPHLHILVRAANRYDAYDQMNAGMLHVYRETLDTSLRLGVDAMSILGYRTYTAKRLARTFLKLDEKNLKKLASIRNQEEYVAEAKKYIEELELIIQNDNTMNPDRSAEEWSTESLRGEAQTSVTLPRI